MRNHSMFKKLVVVCLINFLVAALMGLALRFSVISDIGINYRFFTHAHSHVAMLGWVYLMLFALIVHYFIPNKKALFNTLFWVTEFAVVGMMLSFPYQGYAAVSITFSTLHILCSYYFVYLVWKYNTIESFMLRCLLKTALVFMVLSTIGVWCLGPAVTMAGKASAFYQIAIQFFLHFQFNGWFLIATLAIFFYLIKVEASKWFRYFIYTLIAGTVLTVALPIYWFTSIKALSILNQIGIVMQVISLCYFLKLIKPKLSEVLKQKSKLQIYLYNFSVFCFALKLLIPLVTFIPEFSLVDYTHRNLVIGFIHLIMLGTITGFLFAFILDTKLVTYNKILTFGVVVFILGFIFLEALLGTQGVLLIFGGILLPNYSILLFITSILLPLGVFCVLFNVYKTPQKAELQ